MAGFGHRIYRTSDPRSFIIRKTAEEVSHTEALGSGVRPLKYSPSRSSQ